MIYKGIKIKHGIIKCKNCDKIIIQCKCPYSTTNIKYSICEECDRKEKRS